MSAHAPLPRRRIPVWRTVIGVGVLAFVLTLLYEVMTGQIRRFEVISNSMAPTLNEGDKLLVVQPKQYLVDDIVVFSRPEAPKTLLIKRAVVRGPARVETRGGYLYVDGARSDPPQGDYPDRSTPDNAWFLQADEFFLVGDNRMGSMDSRHFGPIPLTWLKGILVLKDED